MAVEKRGAAVTVSTAGGVVKGTVWSDRTVARLETTVLLSSGVSSVASNWRVTLAPAFSEPMFQLMTIGGPGSTTPPPVTPDDRCEDGLQRVGHADVSGRHVPGVADGQHVANGLARPERRAVQVGGSLAAGREDRLIDAAC